MKHTFKLRVDETVNSLSGCPLLQRGVAYSPYRVEKALRDTGRVSVSCTAVVSTWVRVSPHAAPAPDNGSLSGALAQALRTDPSLILAMADLKFRCGLGL